MKDVLSEFELLKIKREEEDKLFDKKIIKLEEPVL